MRRIVHLSDIHFGRVEKSLIDPLIRCIHELRPSIVVVSGDLTQRALPNQYRAARQFLTRLPGPQIVVPGNHDMPIFNPVDRVLSPFRLFKRFITRDMYPFYQDDNVAILGLNTARGSKTTYGHISRKQLDVVREKLCDVPSTITKILVTHHPFDLPAGYHNPKQIVRRAERAMKVLAECGVDLFLAGHLHTVFTRPNTERYTFSNYSALIIQAGTASALRKGANTFNMLELDDHELRVNRYDWAEREKRFAESSSEAFRHTVERGWLRAD
jgi:3',5'-cyclic AMP phosphodiesterase CpdA